MKRTLTVIGQSVLFLLVYAVGAFWDPFHLRGGVWHPTTTSVRYYVPDGLILTLLLYVFFLGIAAARKRLKVSGGWTTVALAVALFLGVWAKLGWKTIDLFG
jgi:hypothetical protein